MFKPLRVHSSISSWSEVNEVDVVGKGEIMHLTQVNRHHQGVYQCTASNGVGKTAVSQINLRVLRKFILFFRHYPQYISLLISSVSVHKTCTYKTVDQTCLLCPLDSLHISCRINFTAGKIRNVLPNILALKIAPNFEPIL